MAFNPLIQKLEAAGGLTDADRAMLDSLHARQRRVDAHQDLSRTGDRPEDVHLVIDGWACRYKIMPQGRRHILALLIPGDFCDLHVAILSAIDHSVMALTPCTIVDIPRATVLELTNKHPRITRALWWAALVDESVLREWLASLGQREAEKRTAHLFCELLVRLQQVGLADANSYDMPLRQAELADALGITAVHVNRSLKALRDAGLVVLKNRRVTIPDVARLNTFCGFDRSYLHLTPRAAKMDI